MTPAGAGTATAVRKTVVEKGTAATLAGEGNATNAGKTVAVSRETAAPPAGAGTATGAQRTAAASPAGEGTATNAGKIVAPMVGPTLYFRGLMSQSVLV